VRLRLPKHLAKAGHGTARPRFAGTGRSAIDLCRVANFGECRCTGGGDGDQQQLVATAEQVDLLMVANGARPSTSNASLGNVPSAQATLGEAAHDHEKDSQDHGQTAADGMND